MFFSKRPSVNPIISNLKLILNRSKTSQTECDVLVIGAGAGGYTAAVRAAQKGFNTICIEKERFVGGAYIMHGCIPSKNLLWNTFYYYQCQKGRYEYRGLKCEGMYELNLERMMLDKEQCTEGLSEHLLGNLRKNKVTLLQGRAHLQSPNEVLVTHQDGKSLIKTKKVILAVGSLIRSHPKIQIDEKNIVSSDYCHKFDAVPKSIIIIGAGIVGVEFASIWSRLGSKVTILGTSAYIGGSALDAEISAIFHKELKKQGIKFRSFTMATKASKASDHVKLVVHNVKNSSNVEVLKAEKVMVSIGRVPATRGLGLENLGVKLNKRGYIVVDSNLQSSVPGVYAVGDCIPGPALATKAEGDAIHCVAGLTNEQWPLDYSSLPTVIFVHPEIGVIGMNEQQLLKSKTAYIAGRSQFIQNWKARICNQPVGLIKVLVSFETNEILGTHVIGASAAEVVNEVSLIMRNKKTLQDVLKAVHVSTSYGRAFREACENAITGDAVIF